MRREKECALEELYKAQDIISRMKIEKNNKSIDLYDPNNPEILQKKLSNLNNLELVFRKVPFKTFYLFLQSIMRSKFMSWKMRMKSM